MYALYVSDNVWIYVYMHCMYECMYVWMYGKYVRYACMNER